MSPPDEIDPIETPVDPNGTQLQPPLSGTVDDNDDTDDERWDENEPPDRALTDTRNPQDEFRLEKAEEDEDEDLADVDAADDDDTDLE